MLSAEEQAGWTRTKATGELSTRRSDLKRAAHHDPVKALADASVLDKVLSAFGPGLAGFTSPVTGRIHASFNVGATAAGRASGGRPYLQQIPRVRASGICSSPPPAASSSVPTMPRWNCGPPPGFLATGP